MFRKKIGKLDYSLRRPPVGVKLGFLDGIGSVVDVGGTRFEITAKVTIGGLADDADNLYCDGWVAFTTEAKKANLSFTPVVEIPGIQLCGDRTGRIINAI